MIRLSAEDQRATVELLVGLEAMSTEDSRRQVLSYAGLGHLAHLLDLSGSTFVASNRLVSFLLRYGRTTYDSESLGVLLNSIKALVGSQQRDLIDSLLVKYSMMVPIVEEPPIGVWLGEHDALLTPEKVIGRIPSSLLHSWSAW